MFLFGLFTWKLTTRIYPMLLVKELPGSPFPHRAIRHEPAGRVLDSMFRPLILCRSSPAPKPRTNPPTPISTKHTLQIGGPRTVGLSKHWPPTHILTIVCDRQRPAKFHPHPHSIVVRRGSWGGAFYGFNLGQANECNG